jgi:beta-xylosidase
MRSLPAWRSALATLLLAGAGPAHAQETASVLDGGDPTLIFADGQAWLYPTGGNTSLSSWSSADLKTWRAHGPLLHQRDIAWIDDDGAPRHSLWAPDMVQTKKGWFFYYSVGPQTPTPSRIGVARCSGPAGPCTDSGKPLLTGGDGFEAIDPMVFRDPRSGKAYLYAGGSAGATLRVFELGADMISLAREVKIEQPPHFTEGAFMHERDGVYYLSYSHGKWNDASYAVHYATAPGPIGPWTYRGVILQSDARIKGPGHHSFLRDPRTGTWLIAYHRWEGKSDDGPYRGSRRIAIQPIAYGADGLIAPIAISR